VTLFGGTADCGGDESTVSLMASTAETPVGVQMQVHERLSCHNRDRLPFLGILTILPFVRTEESAMPTDATLTSKGQTTIPKEIRDGLGMKTGDRITFTLMSDATVLMRVKNKSVTELAGLLHKKGRKPVPIEQLSR